MPEKLKTSPWLANVKLPGGALDQFNFEHNIEQADPMDARKTAEAIATVIYGTRYTITEVIDLSLNNKLLPDETKEVLWKEYEDNCKNN